MTDKNQTNSPSEVVVNHRQIQTSVREDLDAGLRFLHLMGMQTKLDLSDMVSTLFALLEELVESGQLNVESFEQRRSHFQEKEEARLRERPHVQVADPVDKYTLDNLPQIDCESRLHLCKARCCKHRLSFNFPGSR